MRILMIDIDTLRPDHMSCYGYPRRTTPNIDRVAERGLTMNQYYTSDAPCLPSRSALISGRFGIHTGIVGHGGTAADRFLTGTDRGFRDCQDLDNLNFLLRKAGLYTASISTFAERHSAYWFNAGCNETYNVGKCGLESGEEVIPVVLDWLEREQEREDWFLHVHLWDPHTPYRAPESFGNPFAGQPLPQWLTRPGVLDKHLKHIGPHSLLELNMYTDEEDPRYPRHPGRATDMSGLRRIIDGYDCGISYADSLVGEIFALLEKQGIYEDTAIIITSDHGENLGELGIYAEHATADIPTCRIPMIIRWPGGKEGLQDDELHYNLDLLPTLADLLGLPHAESWDGKSYASTITSAQACSRPYLVLSQMAHVCQRSVRFADYLYLRTYHDGYHLFLDEMLFNIRQDPYEENDLTGKMPEIAGQGARLLAQWHEEMMASARYKVDPLQTVLAEGGPLHARGHLNEYIERLERTGRQQGADKLKEKHVK